jgi:hypothetical protein
MCEQRFCRTVREFELPCRGTHVCTGSRR